jgi:hypothetical protein
VATIIAERLEEVASRGLKRGAHSDPVEGMCAMEAAAYVAGEPWSDNPQCVSPVIAAFLRNWNDSLPSADRDRLIPPDLIALTIGTRGSDALEHRRSLMAADWLVRTHTVAWLRLANLDAQADALAALPEITRMEQVPSIRGPLEAARRDADAARAAARAAAGDAARDAAWDAARDAAWDAAWDAAGDAARAAAWDAARAAAWDAAGDAAGDAARAAVKLTTVSLQASAGDLIRRMCKLTGTDVAQAAAV